MSTRIAVDGLWQCLCPLYNAAHLARPLLRPTKSPGLRVVRALSNARINRAQAISELRKYSNEGQAELAPTSLSPRSANNQPSVPNELAPTSLSSTLANNQPGASKGKHARTQRRWEPTGFDLHLEPTPVVFELLRVAASHGDIGKVEGLVKLLITERRQEPDVRIYSSLILANIDPVSGSIARVNSLLEDMDRDGLTLDAGACHDVLKVLSVHLDYLLRAEILEYMQKRWFALNETGHHDVVIALIREGQLELACDKLSKMRRDGMEIQNWLDDAAVYALTDAGEMEEALQIMKQRASRGLVRISKSVWYRLLDTASESRHHAAAAYAWNSQVLSGYIIPPSGICRNVLTTAAEAGDVRLAADVFRVLGVRGTIFTAGDYEELIKAHLNAPTADIRAALVVLCVMNDTKIVPTSASTRSLYLHLSADPSRVRPAFDIINKLKQDGRQIPLAALNVIVEAYVAQSNFVEALNVYKVMHEFSPPRKGPFQKPFANVDTFNQLFKGARRTTPPALHTAMFLASEQVALGIKPDSVSYDRLIYVCLRAEDLDQAWKYFEAMGKAGFSMRVATATTFAKALARKHDDRCWDFLQIMKDKGEARMLADTVEIAWAKGQE